MGLYLNQLPQTEVARLKAELAETLIANFCYPRFYDYRVNALRMRPVDRSKRQEVWQYLNAVDFNVWGRVDVDSPDFQRQVERLFIHFVQRNRNFFGPQGRRRMIDVRSLITSTSNAFAEGLRRHLQGKPENPPFGSPRPPSSWSAASVTGRLEPAWERVLTGTMQLQQQLQELRNEAKPQSGPVPSQQSQTSPPPLPSRSSSVPSRRARTGVSPANGTTSNGNGVHENETMVWPTPGNRSGRSINGRAPMAPSTTSREPDAAFPVIPPPAATSDLAPNRPLPGGKGERENLPAAFEAIATPETPPLQQTRLAQGKLAEPGSSAVVEPQRKATPQHPLSAQPLHAVAATGQSTDLNIPPGESPTVTHSDEDVVIFEQLRHQLVVWLRVESVRAGIELSGLGAFQLLDALRQQDGIDPARLQVVSTLLNMCDQIISSSRATLFDYKQAMMFYLMHTRRAR